MTDAANSSSPTTPGSKPNWSASDVAKYLEDVIAPLRAVAKHKERSYTTSKTVHMPLLEAATKDTPDQGPTVVLLGDSMLERMTTTGQSPNFTAPWPSLAMLPDEMLEALRRLPEQTAQRLSDSKEVRRLGPLMNRIDRVFNAGVGGDKIQNLAYRLAGDPETDLPGLLPILARCGTVRLWVVHIGSNNLSPKRGLSTADLSALEVLVETLLRLPTKGVKCKVLLTGILDRTDVPKELVAKANQDVEELDNMMKLRWGPERVNLYEPPDGHDLDVHLDDHVHLNLEGYRWWIPGFLEWVVVLLDASEAETERWRKLGGFAEDREIPWFADTTTSDQCSTTNDGAADAADADNDNAPR